jgi:hypothetical protein
MANQNTISVQLTVNDDGSVTMQQFGKNTEDAMNKVSSSTKNTVGPMETLKNTYVDMMAKAATAYMAVQTAMDYMEKGVKAMQAEDTFKTLTDSSDQAADDILANLKRATDGTITDSQLMQKAVKANLLDFTAEQTQQMAEMARQAARESGEDVNQTFDTIVNAISTNMPRGLKQYGLVTKEQMTLINQAIADGVPNVNLLSFAWENYQNQIAKIGPLEENEAERLQKTKSGMDAAAESAGKLLQALKSTFTTLSTEPMDNYFERLAGLSKEDLSETGDNYNIVHAVVPTQPSSAEAELRAAQTLMAQKKADVETMKALDKDYLTSQEANIKVISELRKAAGDDDYKIACDSLVRQEALNAEYYTRMKAEIDAEAAARSKADRDKISDAAFTAQKMQELDAQTANKAISLMQQRTVLSISTAQADIKNLTSRLADYQKYYDSLKAMMDKNLADEKQHLAELTALQKQYKDNQTSTAAQLALVNGTNKNMSPQQTYDSARSALNQQFMDITNTMTGQDQYNALEKYKQAVVDLQQQFQKGISGAKDLFGGESQQDIISAAKVAEDASSDLNRAYAIQQQDLVSLADAKQQQITTDQLWAQTLQQSMTDAQNEMDKLKATILDLSDQIKNMQKTVELTGVDHVSSVVDSIISRIQLLHTLANEPIVIAASGGASVIPSLPTNPYDSSLNLDSGLNLNAGLALGSYASGTDYVPRTGLYQLHQGEKVITASENNGGSRSVSIGNLNINIPANAAPQSAADWRSITRNIIVPELRKLNS